LARCAVIDDDVRLKRERVGAGRTPMQGKSPQHSNIVALTPKLRTS
jgi:hypothetical protein